MKATVSLVLAAALGAVAFAGCEMSRFPTCKNDAECVQKSGKQAPYCYDLRCVACRNDDDCSAGSTCNSANECKELGSMGAKPPPTAAATSAPAPAK